LTTLTFDVALFREQFPAFSDVTTFPDAMLQMYWDMATCYISDCDYGWLNGTCRQLAINLMTAHLTALSVLIAAGTTPQLISSSTVDKITVTLKMPETPNQWRWWLNTTPYGMQLLALLSAQSVGGFYIGGLPELSGFRKVYGTFVNGYIGRGHGGCDC
jgi:hypothetical protein